MTGTTETGSPQPATPATLHLHRFWVVFAVGLILDQVSKWLVVQVSGFQLGLYPPFGGKVLIPGFLNLAYAVNYGAAWGFLEGYSWLLVILAGVVLALITIFHKDLGLQYKANQYCFGMICSGIIGNTIDRIYRGHVVDFIDMRLPGYQWPTYNVADSAIVIGTFWYIFLQFRQNKRK